LRDEFSAQFTGNRAAVENACRHGSRIRLQKEAPLE
jgi:hypothetical protein